MWKIMKKIENSEVSHRIIGVNLVLGVSLEDNLETKFSLRMDHSQWIMIEPGRKLE